MPVAIGSAACRLYVVKYSVYCTKTMGWREKMMSYLFYTYLQPNLPSHIKNCIIHMIWRAGRAVSYPPRYRPPSDSVRRALVPQDAATWTPVEGHPSARRPVLHPQNMAPKNCAPPGPRAFFRTVSVRSKAPAAMFRRTVRGGKGGMGEGAGF